MRRGVIKVTNFLDRINQLLVSIHAHFRQIVTDS